MDYKRFLKTKVTLVKNSVDQCIALMAYDFNKEVYRKDAIYKISYGKSSIILFIFVRKSTSMAPLIFYQELSSPVKRTFCVCISWNTEKRIEPYRAMYLFSFQESTVDNISSSNCLWKLQHRISWKPKRFL